MHASPLGRVVGKDVARFEHTVCVMVNEPELDEIAGAPLKTREPSPTFETVSGWLPLCPLNTRPPVVNHAAGPAKLISGVTVSPSVTVIVSGSPTGTVVGGRGGVDVVAFPPLSAMDCV